MIRHNWTEKEISSIYNSPLIELIYKASNIHRQYFDGREIQISRLVSIKTGGCPEDCSYCPQAARYKTKLKKQNLMNTDEVVKLAHKAKEEGASRVCLGASWREVKDGKQFDQVLDMVKHISSLNLEVCCTLGMLNQNQAKKLKEAGLYAYNHNIDSSRKYYTKVISTRTYDDRLKTIQNVRQAKLTVCCGGILGLGEEIEDRLQMLQTLSNMNPHPESVPINTLVAIKGTPLEKQEQVSNWELIKMVATARIVMPQSWIRLSAGRLQRSQETQALCFLAGANSIFSGEKLLTTPNPKAEADRELFNILGLKSYKQGSNESDTRSKSTVETTTNCL